MNGKVAYTIQDLTTEYKKEIGYDKGHSNAPISFNNWCIEKLLEYKNNDNKKDILPSS